MRIPSRTQVDAFCGAPATRYQRVAAILAPAILLGTIVYLLILLPGLPERIPSNYNMAGEITDTSGRGALLIMPVFGLVMDLFVALVGRFPRSWNTGKRVTVLNRARIYRLIRDLMADYRLTMAVMFGGYAVYQSTLPEHFSSLILPAMLLLTLLPILRYLLRLPRA